MSIPEHIIEEIKSRSSITEVCGEFVELRRSGSNALGLCPFHSEKSPSFNVREEHGTFHCFGCGKHGNVFTLLMELRGMSFPESVRYLARRLGIEIPEDARQNREQDDQLRKRRTAARMVCAAAVQIFRQTLRERGAPQEYLRERGVRSDLLETFHLGFAPDARNFLLGAMKHIPECSALPEEELLSLLEEVGLLKQREPSTGPGQSESREGKLERYDVFRNRIIFPIERSDGAPIAFGGRILPQQLPTKAPKYLNSKETLLYSKRQTLYGIPQAMKELRLRRHAFVVEGYMDVLGMHQAGAMNVVATCGTAVTEQHAALLRRFVERATVVFDGDEAGTKAAASCFEAFLNSGLDCFAVSLPEGEDPDTLAKRLPQNEFLHFLDERKRPLFEIFLDRLIAEVSGGESTLSPTTTGKAALRLVQIFSRVKNSVEREFLLRRGSERLGVTVGSLEKLIAESGRSFAPRRAAGSPPAPSPIPRPPKMRPAAASAAQLRYQPAPAPPAPPQQPSSAAQKKALKFYEQLLLAVIAEPSLAPELLRVSSIEEPEKNIRMPEKLRRFLHALCERLGGSQNGSFDEMGAWDGSGEITPDELARLLEAHGFPSRELLDRARRQLGRPGGSAGQIVQSAVAVTARHSLEREIDTLRTRQAQQEDAEYVLKIAQEKLEKRRSLERINRGGE